MKVHRNLRIATALLLVVAILASCATQPGADSDDFTISVIGLNDVHGELVSKPERAGLVGLSGIIDALRAARGSDGGAVLVVDAGDMWQGTLESNLREGAAVVESYNAIGVSAAAIGNHEFDFGPAGTKAIPVTPTDDPRGALKQRATEADFPLLAANIIDEATGKPVTWENVQPSTIVDVQGVKIGIIGVLSARGLQATISANTGGLRIAPLAGTIADEARKLRASGATIVIVAAHAGSRCTEFQTPSDTSSCNMGGEIMQVATELPAGLVDHIVAGHVHQGIAHVVNGISITSSYSNTRAFSRVDLTVSRRNGAVIKTRVFRPQQAITDTYEGHNVVPNPAVREIAKRATAFAESTKQEKLGVYLTSAFPHPPSTESPLANLMTEAILDTIDGDVAIHNVVGGIRNTLPPGDLTFGSVYEMFPFDNRVVIVELSGAELREVLAHQAYRHRRRAGISGISVSIKCVDEQLIIVAKRPDGHVIQDDEGIRLVANDFLTLGGDDILTPVIPAGGFDIDNSMPLVRDVLITWFENGPDTLSPQDFQSDDEPRWTVPATLPEGCTL